MITLIHPPLIGQKKDVFGSMPAIPTGICFVASYIRRKGIEVNIIDGYGNNPFRCKEYLKDYLYHGQSIDDIIDQIPNSTSLVGLTVHSGQQHLITIDLLNAIKKKNKNIKTVLGGNHATVVWNEFLANNADYIIFSEGEAALYDLIKYLDNQKSFGEIDGIAGKEGVNPKTKFLSDIELLDFPAYDLLPLEKYWELGIAHAPFFEKYLPLLTSRGCPYTCKFCSTPEIYKRTWRAKSARRVVDEMLHFYNMYGIREYQIQDENFVVNSKRVKDICEEIISLKLNFRLSLPSGVRVELLNESMLELMSKAGIKYMCIAPESGSKKILKTIDKNLDYKKLYQLCKVATEKEIKMGSFIIIGIPGEDFIAYLQTIFMVIKMTILGVDEFSIFIYTPLPGAEVLHDDLKNFNYKRYEELCWTPRYRLDYKKQERKRLFLYLLYFSVKSLFHPLRIIKSIINIKTKKCELKSEMLISKLKYSRLKRVCVN